MLGVLVTFIFLTPYTFVSVRNRRVLPMIYTLRSVLLFGDPLSGWTVGLHPLWLEVIQDWLLVAPGTVEIGVAR